MATNVGAEEQNGAEAAERRLRMVNGQLRTADVTNNTLLSAFLAVGREAFVAPAFAGLAYLDQDLSTGGFGSRKLLAPRTIARLLQAAEVNPGDRALEVGGGSGYGSALLANLGASVTLLETDTTLAGKALRGESKVTLVTGDLAKGATGKGPFDVIVINGAFEVPPTALIAELADRGRLVAIDARDDSPRGVLILKSGRSYSERPLFDASGDVLPGFAKAAAFAF